VSDAVEYLTSPQGRTRLRASGLELIVDLDDTLISNQSLFLDAAQQLGAIFQRLSGGRDPGELLAEHAAFDVGLIGQLGLTPLRWRASALGFASQLKGASLTVEEIAELLEAAEVGLMIGEPLAGAIVTLELLREEQVPVILVTRGDRTKQREKIHVHGLDDLVAGVEIVSAKDASTFAGVADKHGLRSPVSIGDSLRSDIYPAMEAGFQAVHITSAPNAGWDTGHHADDQVPGAPTLADAVLVALGG